MLNSPSSRIKKVTFFRRSYKFFTSLLIISLSIYYNNKSFAQSEENDTTYTSIEPLFTAEDPLELTIITDFKQLLADKEEEEPAYNPGQLILIGSDTGNQTFDLKVRARGISRRQFNCSFPPLLLNFKKKATKGTVFEGQNKVKLVTYCKDVSKFEEYVLKEYLTYKLFNILTDTSLQVRLAHITYQDQGKEKLLTERFGFMIEDIDHLARRLGGKEIDNLLPNHDMCDRTSLDRFMIFQYLIGNTDWWIAKPVMHNVKLITIDSSPPIPIPYDFDYCGLVDADYATTDEKLPITAVTQRYFRGYCRRPGSYEKTLQVFIERKEKIYNLIQDFPYISETTRKVALKYFDSFYKIIEDPKQVIKRFYDDCSINHDHLHKM